MDWECISCHRNFGRGNHCHPVAIIVTAVIYSTLRYLYYLLLRRNTLDKHFTQYKHSLGRALLLGLEILVAADVIRTVALEPSFTSVGVLGILVVIRTFLSWSLVVEIEGHWPWQGPQRETN
jgi:uncharacterized membrane protein